MTLVVKHLQARRLLIEWFAKSPTQLKRLAMNLICWC